MSVIPQVECKRCGKAFSSLRPRCPYCGTRRVKTGDRVPMTTASQNRGTPAAERAVVNTKWQMIFGLILLVAVVLAVITLVTIGLNDSKIDTASAPQNAPVVNTATPVTPTETIAPTEDPQTSDSPDVQETDTPDPSDSPAPQTVQSITLTFLGSPRSEFATAVGDEVQLKAQVYPATDAEIQWESADPSVATVTDGVVKGVKSGTTTITATCDGVTAKCIVYVT